MIKRLNRIVVLPVLCCALLMMSATHNEAQTAHAGKLTVKVTGFHNTDGNLLIHIRSDEKTVVATRTVEIDAKTMKAQTTFCPKASTASLHFMMPTKTAGSISIQWGCRWKATGTRTIRQNAWARPTSTRQS